MIDIGANLTHESFQTDLYAVLASAKAAGVEDIIVTGASLQGSTDALAMAKHHDGLFATAGIHPHEASNFTTDALQQLKKLAIDSKVVAMGECGLDFYRDFSPRDAQEDCFAQQLELASETGKPVFLHERDAHDRFVAILEPFLSKLNKVVVHCFTGNKSQLQRYLRLGCYIGITGWICDERRGHHIREFIDIVPANRLMVETDSPYLLPRDLKPKPKSRRNEPKHLAHIVNTIAQITGKPVQQVADETSQTAREFFGI